MALTFPTLAEQAEAEFRNATKTVSIATIARRMGADVEKQWDKIVYCFDDDTRLETSGRGLAHRITAYLP